MTILRPSSFQFKKRKRLVTEQQSFIKPEEKQTLEMLPCTAVCFTVKSDNKVTGVKVKNADEPLLRLMGRGERSMGCK